MQQVRRVTWETPQGEQESGWFHQFIAVHDGDKFIVPSAIVETDEGEVKVLENVDGPYWTLRFDKPCPTIREV